MIEMLLLALRLYELILIVRVVISWIRVDTSHPVVQWIYKLTEPVLAPIRLLIPTEKIGIDLSPIVVLLIITLIRRLVY